MPSKKKYSNLSDRDPSKRNTPMTYSLNENPEEGRCRLILDEYKCNAPVKTRGLCATHYQRFIMEKNKININKFGTPLKDK